jgi:hypothetical protein
MVAFFPFFGETSSLWGQFGGLSGVHFRLGFGFLGFFVCLQGFVDFRLGPRVCDFQDGDFGVDIRILVGEFFGHVCFQEALNEGFGLVVFRDADLVGVLCQVGDVGGDLRHGLGLAPELEAGLSVFVGFDFDAAGCAHEADGWFVLGVFLGAWRDFGDPACVCAQEVLDWSFSGGWVELDGVAHREGLSGLDEAFFLGVFSCQVGEPEGLFGGGFSLEVADEDGCGFSGQVPSGGEGHLGGVGLEGWEVLAVDEGDGFGGVELGAGAHGDGLVGGVDGLAGFVGLVGADSLGGLVFHQQVEGQLEGCGVGLAYSLFGDCAVVQLVQGYLSLFFDQGEAFLDCGHQVLSGLWILEGCLQVGFDCFGVDCSHGQDSRSLAQALVDVLDVFLGDLVQEAGHGLAAGYVCGLRCCVGFEVLDHLGSCWCGHGVFS